MGIRVEGSEDLSGQWGIENVFFIRGVAPQWYCQDGSSLSPAVPCDSASARLELTLRLTTEALVVGVSGIWFDMSNVRFGLSRLLARGARVMASPVTVEEQTVPFARELRDSLVSVEWESVPLAEAVRVFAIGPVRSVVVDRSVGGLRITGRFSRVPFFRALWDVLAGYSLRAEKLGTSAIRISAAPPRERRP